MNPKIKICGLTTPTAITTAIENGARYIGFIFFSKSPRNLTIDEASHLRPFIKLPVKLVAVTVDADDSLLDAIVTNVQPDIIQCHGKETPARLLELKKRYGLPLIKAFSIRNQSDFDQVSDYSGIVDMVLFDAKAPDGSQLPGGNGISFDWSLMKSLDADCKTVLSGGLNAGNVEQAIAMTHPSVLDVSSGVESAPGVKDDKLIKEFFDAVKKTII